MSISKAWDWNKESCPVWLQPSEESYYVSRQWKERGVKSILDFGCGLGRHSIFLRSRALT